MSLSSSRNKSTKTRWPSSIDFQCWKRNTDHNEKYHCINKCQCVAIQTVKWFSITLYLRGTFESLFKINYTVFHVTWSMYSSFKLVPILLKNVKKEKKCALSRGYNYDHSHSLLMISSYTWYELLYYLPFIKTSNLIHIISYISI